MDKEEKLLKGYIKRKLDLGKTNRTTYCLNETILLDYLKQRLSSQEREMIESHIASCGFCLSQINLMFEAQMVSKKRGLTPVPQELIDKAKALLKTDKNSGGTKMAARRKIKKNFFLSAAIVFFILSFLIPRYFMQFLVGTLILGLAWVFESENCRTLIMVLDSWRKHSHDTDEKISQHLKKRF